MGPLPHKILLVYPPVPPETYWSFRYALGLLRKRCAMPPLGLITVAAMLPAQIELRLKDMNIDQLEAHDVRWADMVFVSAMLVQRKSVLEIVTACNRMGVPVVVGGPYATGSPEELAGADHLLLGEVEATLPGFLTDLAQGRAKRIYAAPSPPDLTRSPRPRFDLLNLGAYASMAVQYSRGCPFHCEFCDIWVKFGNRPRVKAADQMLQELDALYHLGWRGAVFVVDDNFIGNRKRVKQELLPALARWQAARQFPFRFFTEASVDLAQDAKLLEGMRQAGFNEVFLGIETPSAAALDETGKLQNLRCDLAQAVRTIQQNGLEVMGGFILGFDSDDEDIFDRQIAFIQRTAIPQAMIGLLTALPGTRLHQRLAREGRLRQRATGNNTHGLTTNFRPRMSADRLRRGYSQVLETLYGGNLAHYFRRCRDLLDRLPPHHYMGRRLRLAEFLILLRSLLRQPFTPYGLQYLRFLGRTLARTPWLFAQAVKLAVVGHHYHLITREMLKSARTVGQLERIQTVLREKLAGSLEARPTPPGLSPDRLAAAWRWSADALSDVRRRIEKIHVDFRADILHQYEALVTHIHQHFEPFASELRRLGISLAEF